MHPPGAAFFLEKLPVVHGLPDEMFGKIQPHFTDVETRSICLNLSGTFRHFVQEHVLYGDNMFLEACEN